MLDLKIMVGMKYHPPCRSVFQEDDHKDSNIFHFRMHEVFIELSKKKELIVRSGHILGEYKKV